MKEFVRILSQDNMGGVWLHGIEFTRYEEKPNGFYFYNDGIFVLYVPNTVTFKIVSNETH